VNRYDIALGKLPPPEKEFPKKNVEYFVTKNQYELLGNRTIFLGARRSGKTQTLVNHARCEMSRGVDALYVCPQKSYIPYFYGALHPPSTKHIPGACTWVEYQTGRIRGNRTSTIYFDDIDQFDEMGIIYTLGRVMLTGDFKRTKILATCDLGRFSCLYLSPDEELNLSGYSWGLYRLDGKVSNNIQVSVK
jgi:hypothetical protein